MNIKLLTFKTNHTILGDVEISNETIKIKQPVQVVVIPPKSAQDQGGMAFSPFLDYCAEFKTGISFHRNDILAITTPVVELENQYNSVFGSGIQIATSIPK